MTLYTLVAFHRALGPRHNTDEPVEYETRVSGRVPRSTKRDALDWSLVDQTWELGYPIEALGLNGLIAQCRFEWRYEVMERISGIRLAHPNMLGVTGDPALFAYIPQVIPEPAQIKLHEIGTWTFDGVERQVVVVTQTGGLYLKGTDHYRDDGYYCESVAKRNSRHPEFVAFVFQRMRELGFKSTEDEYLERSV